MKGTRIGANRREHITLPTADTFDDTTDLDYIAIERAINGDPIRLSADEKLYAARILDARGMDPTAIAKRIRVTGPIVAAWKANSWKRGAPWRPAGVAA